jgi:hypothetical protein
VESSELVYQPLDFEDKLFTARVYKRKYRPLRLRQTLWRGGRKRQMENQPDTHALGSGLPQLSGQGMGHYRGLRSVPLDDVDLPLPELTMRPRISGLADLTEFAQEPLRLIDELADDLDASSIRELMERDQKRQDGDRRRAN